MFIKIKKIDPIAVIPSKAHDGDAGFDLVAIDDGVVDSSGFIQYRTGLSIEPPEGVHTEIWPRSSISKYDLLMANSIGLIDNQFRGELMIRFKPALRFAQDSKNNSIYATLPVNLRKYKKGDKIAQLVISQTIKAEFVESENLSETVRGSGGFGSTGG